MSKVSKGPRERLPLLWDTTQLKLPTWEGQMEGTYQTSGDVVLRNRVVDLKLAQAAPLPGVRWVEDGKVTVLDMTVPMPSLFVSAAWESEARGATVATFESGRESFRAFFRHGDATLFDFDFAGTVEAMLFERYRTERRALLTHLPVPYYSLVPRALRRPIKRLAGLLRGGPRRGSFPTWPGTTSLLALMSLSPACVDAEPWPDDSDFALVLTHDVESSDGIRLAEEAAKVEADHGVKSTWFIVGRLASEARRLADRLKADGHEIGLHGVEHDMVFPFLSRADMEKRLDGCQSFIDDYEIKGFRSPALLRSDLMYEVVGERFAYDSSVVDSGRLAPHARPTGCCSIFPFRRGQNVVIPITIPFDASLLFLGYSHEHMPVLWDAKVDFICDEGGVAVMDTHPEPHFSGSKRGLAAYESFLRAMGERSQLWNATAGELADFVTHRGEGTRS